LIKESTLEGLWDQPSLLLLRKIPSVLQDWLPNRIGASRNDKNNFNIPGFFHGQPNWTSNHRKNRHLAANPGQLPPFILEQ
jgi:hypothetical protein